MADQPFRDAEAWLAERGVRRDPLRVRPDPPDPPDDPAAAAAPDVTTSDATPHQAVPPPEPSPPADDEPPVSAREAARLAQASSDEQVGETDRQAADPHRRTAPRLEDEVADAVAFVRRSTATTPQAEGRLADKLAQRGWPATVVEQAMQRCRAAGLVDDAAMAAALVDEGRRKGHAPTRLRADLKRRGLPEDAIEWALAPLAEEDPEAAAFAVAREKADRLTGVSAETAFRRIVAHLARRGHPEAIARKVARAAVFDARDPERTAGR